MSLPLNLVIDRTAGGKLRAEVAGHPESAVEAADVAGLMNAVQELFLSFLSGEAAESALSDDDDRALRRLAMEKTPDGETLGKLIARYPVPDHWPEGDEDWGHVP